MKPRRRAPAVLGALTVLGACVPAAAAADDPGPSLSISSDGVLWSADLAKPLFDERTRWVPGDARTTSFFVRNDSPYDTSLRIEAHDASTRALTAAADVMLFARTAGSAWEPLTIDAESGRLNATAIPSGRASQVDIRALFAPAAGNDTQSRTAELSFVVRLDDVRGESGGTGTGSGHPSGHHAAGLPGTGAPDTTLLAAGGGLFIGAGVATLRRRKGKWHG